ncbi:MAG TPA: hypothetical protein VFC97_02065 [Verrucomicrobiae bacterium]|jgi:hypothetical protein|nr:hypothetical protein [Verrucomicrobiae bacterium]
MSTLSIVLVVAGVALVALGLSRARAPWGRYQALRAQEANAERYRAWRGGPGRAVGETTGADVMKTILRARVREALLVAAAGVVLAVIGFVIR